MFPFLRRCIQYTRLAPPLSLCTHRMLHISLPQGSSSFPFTRESFASRSHLYPGLLGAGSTGVGRAKELQSKDIFHAGLFPHPVNTSIVRGLNPSNVSPLPARALKLYTCPVHPSIFQCIRRGLRHRCYSSCKAGTSVEHSCLDPGVLSSSVHQELIRGR